jgi:acetyl-CoA synthetase
LRILHSVGEPINPEAWEWYFRVVGNERCPVGSTWWMTETGGGIINALPIPGVNVEVLNQDGTPTPRGERGYFVISNPWPGMPLTIWGDDERYVETYWKKFSGKFYTGDFAVMENIG